MNEASLMRISLLGSVISLFFLYLLTANIHYDGSLISDINENMIGEKINVSGTITQVQAHRNGHVFLVLRDDTGTIKIVLWNSLVKKLSQNGLNVSLLKTGTRLQVIGDVDVYKGEIEIIPKTPNDVKLLS